MRFKVMEVRGDATVRQVGPPWRTVEGARGRRRDHIRQLVLAGNTRSKVLVLDLEDLNAGDLST